MIHLAGIVVATTADLLNTTRLQTVPGNGVLTVEVQADLNDATNNFAITISLPDGETPVDAQQVSGVNPSLAGVIDSRMSDKYRFPIGQGGHPTITLTETGTAILTFRVTFM